MLWALSGKGKHEQWQISGIFRIGSKKRFGHAIRHASIASMSLPPSQYRESLWLAGSIINDARIITRENIALCCCGCNASKGQKPLAVWLQTKYCKDRGITPETVAPVVKQALEHELMVCT